MNKYLQAAFKTYKNYKFKKEKREDIEKRCCPTYDDIDTAMTIGRKLSTCELIDYISNVLEWEDRNIQYWYERSDLDISKFIGKVPIILVILLIILTGTVNNLTTVILLVSFVISIGWHLGISCYQYFRNDHFIAKNNRDEISIKQDLSKIQYSDCMTIEEIIKYKSAVCRDYAKLSCAILLTSLRCDDCLYIITVPNHSACAVKYNTTYYILDQTLPLKQIDMWLINKNEKNANLYKLKVDRVHETISLESHISYKLSIDSNIPKSGINVSYIEKEVSKIYQHISKLEGDNEIIVKINKYFDDTNKLTYYDDITSKSFIRMIKKKIDDDLCDNVLFINSIKVLPHDKLIIIRIT